MNLADTLAADYAKQLWGLSSAVVAFCVLQALTFAYALQKESFRSQVAAARRLVRMAILGALIGYASCVAALDWQQIDILQTLAPKLTATVKIVAAMKVAAVVITCAGAFWLCGRVADKRTR